MGRHHESVGSLALVVADPAIARTSSQPGAVERLLDPGETLVGWCFVSPVSLEPASLPTSRRRRTLRRLTAQHDFRRHVRGGTGTMARLVPRDRGWYLVMTVTDRSISLWDFGLSQREVPGAPLLSFDRSGLVSVRPTGRSDSFGIDTRFRFVDGSFVDLKLMEHAAMAQFWAAVV